MHKVLLAGIILFCFDLHVFSDASLEQGAKASIVVSPVKIFDSVRSLAQKEGKLNSVERIGDTLQSQFKTAINQTRVFNMVERDRLADIQQEQSFQQAASLDGAVEMGRMKGAGYLLFIEVDGFQDRLASKTLGTGRTEAMRSIYLSAQVRIIDTTTGDSLPDIPTAVVEREIYKSQNDGLGQDQTNADKVFVDMAKETANILCQKVIAYIRPGKIIRVKESEIMINRGVPAGFVEGSLVELFEVEEFEDEETGEVFRDETIVGKARITRASDRSSFASIIEGELSEGNMAKVVTTTKPASAPADSSSRQQQNEYYSVPGF